MYKQMCEENPEGSNNAIYEEIAKKMKWTRVGVFKVVKRYNAERPCVTDG